ncbi:hypothetical protein EBZ39_16665 [bacterium]|nr:hypothetical protein [bacterium]
MAFFGGASVANLVGASTSAAGTAGLVPAPAAGKNTRALFSDGSFTAIPILPRRSAETTRYVRNFTETLNVGNSAWNARIRYFAMVFAYDSANINKLLTRTGSGTISSAFNVNIALWDCDENGQPGTYVIGGNITSGTTSNAELSLSVTSTSVTRGWYYISVTPDTNAPSSSLTTQANGNSLAIMFMGGAIISHTSSVWNYTATAYDQTTHETFSRSGSVNPPNVAMIWT